jgi:hypothetical protein
MPSSPSSSPGALPSATVDLRWRALQFNLRPGDYADAFWWPPVLRRAAADAPLGPGTRAVLSRWLLREHALASHLDLDFGPRLKRLWLLPATVLRQLAFDLGVLAWREPIRNCVAGTQRASLREELGAEALALASSARPLRASLRHDGVLPRRLQCAQAGAQLLLATADPVWHAVLRRARLLFGALPGPTWIDLDERDRDAIGEQVLARIADRYPAWHWPFS